MFDHIAIQCSDPAASVGFYEAVLAPLGIHRRVDFGDTIGFGAGSTAQFFVGPISAESPSQETLFAFTAPERAAVDAFCAAATEAGAEVIDEARLEPSYHPDYYAALVRDPDGNSIEAVCHAPA